jgi:ketosteroid isomerase-like protein
MSEEENRDTIERYFQAFEQRDLDAIAELMRDDYVEEFPQSGERIRGKQFARSVLENYPGGLPNLVDRSYVVSGDLGVMKMTLEYGDNRVYACEVIDFQEGKIKRVRAYFCEPFESPEWRARWVESMEP